MNSANAQYENRWAVILGRDQPEDSTPVACYCYNCNKNKVDENRWLYVLTRMIVCPTCGNKRCPHSTDHNLECTNSNQPGQPGSRY